MSYGLAMTGLEVLENQWQNYYDVWSSLPYRSVAQKFLESDMRRVITKFDAAFRERHNLSGIAGREVLIMSDEAEKRRYLQTGENVLSLSAPYVKPERLHNPNLQDDRITDTEYGGPIDLVFENIDWVQFADKTHRIIYHGLSVKGLMPRQGSERLDLIPVFVPLDHMYVHEFARG
jgi:hypothetical protein